LLATFGEEKETETKKRRGKEKREPTGLTGGRGEGRTEKSLSFMKKKGGFPSSKEKGGGGGLERGSPFRKVKEGLPFFHSVQRKRKGNQGASGHLFYSI